MAEFDNRVVAVTGAFGNLGRAVVRAFASEGARVALLDVGTHVPDTTDLGPTDRLLMLGGTELSDAQRTAAAVAVGDGGHL